MFKLDIILMLEQVTAVMESGAAEDYVAARERLPSYPSFQSGIERTSHEFSAIMLPSLERAVELRFRVIAVRRAAATTLAIRLFELEHGRRPHSLAELAPNYLPAIPADPFAGDGRALGYLPDAPVPMLYSINSDGVDDGGEYELGENGVPDNDSKDLVFFLDGDPPPPQPTSAPANLESAKTVENDGEKIRDDRQTDENERARYH